MTVVLTRELGACLFIMAEPGVPRCLGLTGRTDRVPMSLDASNASDGWLSGAKRPGGRGCAWHWQSTRGPKTATTPRKCASFRNAPEDGEGVHPDLTTGCTRS